MKALASKRILVTRAAGQASALAELLQSHGAVPLQIPTIELAPPASYCGLDAALVTLRTYDWLLFTSANAVHAFAARARVLKLSAQARRVAAIGAATARAVVETGVAPAVDLVPPQAVAESLATALLPYAPGSAMLLVRAADARDVLPEALLRAGAQVTVAEAYRNVIPVESARQLADLFSRQPPDAITFTSASTARNLSALLEQSHLHLPEPTVLASIGPVTTHAMKDLGFEPTIEAEEASIASLVEALSRHFSQS